MRPCYLLYLYVWNYATGASSYFYEALFPAWFGFYYLGIQVRCGLKLKCNEYMVVTALLISCMEALGLRQFGMSIRFYISQITVSSFLFSATMIGWFLKWSYKQNGNIKWLSKVGDCSYGIFYIHMFILMLIGELIQSENWYIYWSLRFIPTFMISFSIIWGVQKMLKNKKKFLKNIGFI